MFSFCKAVTEWVPQKILKLDKNESSNKDFKIYIKLMKQRKIMNKIEDYITVEYLKELWDKQEGLCAYTGWSLDNAPKESREKILFILKELV